MVDPTHRAGRARRRRAACALRRRRLVSDSTASRRCGHADRDGDPRGGRSERSAEQRSAATALSVAPPHKQILFGDLQSTPPSRATVPEFAADAARRRRATRSRTPADYARFCSSLDFWSLNDHAEASTPERWRESKEAIRQVQRSRGRCGESRRRFASLGWEWSQVGATPEEHYAQERLLRETADDVVPARRSAPRDSRPTRCATRARACRWLLPFADSRTASALETSSSSSRRSARCRAARTAWRRTNSAHDCYESAATPAELFRKLASGAAKRS